MASIWEMSISILAGNLNSCLSYLITAVQHSATFKLKCFWAKQVTDYCSFEGSETILLQSNIKLETNFQLFSIILPFFIFTMTFFMTLMTFIVMTKLSSEKNYSVASASSIEFLTLEQLLMTSVFFSHFL